MSHPIAVLLALAAFAALLIWLAPEQCKSVFIVIALVIIAGTGLLFAIAADYVNGAAAITSRQIESHPASRWEGIK